MKRITEKDLEKLIERINETGKIKVELYFDYGGIKMVVCRSYSDILNTGVTTKRNCYNAMRSFLIGLEMENKK